MIIAEPEVVTGTTLEPGAVSAEVCPRCATRRIGKFPYCLSCQHDYDGSMLHAPPGLSAADGTSHAVLCPACNTRRIGNFRFCLSCRHDFDEGSPRELSVASLGMARAYSAEMALASMATLGMPPSPAALEGTAPAWLTSEAIAPAPEADAPWSMTPPAAKAAAATAEMAVAAPLAAEPAVDLLTLSPAETYTEPRTDTIDRLISSLEARVGRQARAEPVAVPLVEPVTPEPTRRRISRRLSLVVAVIVIALLGVSGALVMVLARGSAAGQLNGNSAGSVALPSAIPSPTPSPTPIPTYRAGIRPGPITFGTKLNGVTVADPTARVKVGRQIIWVARMSQPSIEPGVEISVSVIVSGKPIIIHRETSAIGVDGLITANPGVNSRDLGPGTFVVRYISQGTILAEGTFTVVK